MSPTSKCCQTSAGEGPQTQGQRQGCGSLKIRAISLQTEATLLTPGSRARDVVARARIVA